MKLFWHHLYQKLRGSSRNHSEQNISAIETIKSHKPPNFRAKTNNLPSSIVLVWEELYSPFSMHASIFKPFILASFRCILLEKTGACEYGGNHIGKKASKTRSSKTNGFFGSEFPGKTKGPLSFYRIGPYPLQVLKRYKVKRVKSIGKYPHHSFSFQRFRKRKACAGIFPCTGLKKK